MTKNELQQIEQLIDLAHVIDALVDICHEKAEHLHANWQDRGMGNATPTRSPAYRPKTENSTLD